MCKFLSWFTTECFRLCFLNFLSKLNGFTYVGPFKNTKGLDKQGPLDTETYLLKTWSFLGSTGVSQSA